LSGKLASLHVSWPGISGWLENLLYHFGDALVTFSVDFVSFLGGADGFTVDAIEALSSTDQSEDAEESVASLSSAYVVSLDVGMFEMPEKYRKACPSALYIGRLDNCFETSPTRVRGLQ
jgi:hypothetical protein